MSAHAKGLLEDLGDEALVRLVAALKARKVVFASNGDIEGLARLLPRPAVTTATTLLANLRSHCPDEAAAGWFLDGMLTQRGQERSRKLLDLVWTGPESELLVNRDPRVVTQDLFRSARTEILLSTFVLHLNCQVMEALADVLEGEPALAGPATESCTSDVLDTRRGQPYQVDIGLVQGVVGGRHGQIGAGQLA